MIHFDFNVSDADAENIFSMMRDRIVENNMRIMKMMSENNNNEQRIEAYRRDNEYVEELIKKMTNVRVEKSSPYHNADNGFYGPEAQGQ